MTNSISEAVARAIAEGLGDNYDHAFPHKSAWNAARGESGGRYRDINEPFQPDYLDAAEAAIEVMSRASQPVDAGVVLCVHGKPYPCERQLDWGCKPADCIPLDSEAVERTVKRALLYWSDLRNDPNDMPARMVRSWHMEIARDVTAALTAMKEDDRG